MIKVEQITPREMISLWSWTPKEQEILLNFGERSTTLVAGWWDGRLMGFLGITESGYVWGQPTPEAGLHPKALALKIRRFILAARELYPVLYGNCSKANWHWNQLCLGAHDPMPQGPYLSFSIKGLI